MNTARRLTWLMAGLCMMGLPVHAQTTKPLVNTSVGNARVIVPDGSSLLQQGVAGPGEVRWFVFGVEPGKTYAVEAVDPYSDLAANTIGSVNVYDASGVAAPPETSVDCTANARAPAVEVASDGKRCIVRTFPPTPGNLQNKRGVYVAVTGVTGTSFQVRVRESTIYGRWSTNGYDFHVELQNTTADAMCAEVIFLPNSGDSFGPPWAGGVTVVPLTVPAFGAVKTVLLNNTTVGPALDKRGTLRIGACGSPNPTNLVPSGLNVSTYAFSPSINQYLYYFPTTANNGATSNSW